MAMAILPLFQKSSLLCSAMVVTLRRNIGTSVVLFKQAKDLDPIQQLFLDKIREYNSNKKAIQDADASYQKKLREETTKLQKQFGLHGQGDRPH